jgi:hypothetical protein
MFDDDNDEIILEEMREEKKSSLKSVLNKKKLSKWEMDEAMMGEI